MPTYTYKAMTENGQIVKNTVDEPSKMSCIRKLQSQNMVPISIVPAIQIGKSKIKKPRNFTKSSDEELRKIGTEKLKEEKEIKKKSIAKKITERVKGVTAKDIRIFTQNLYLLKKAKFNNVHALSTIMESTENPKLKVIIEDILYGVEAGEYMYTTMEYYSNVFPFIYINMIKVGELSGSLDIALSQAIKYLDETEELTSKLKKILIPNIAMFIGIVIMLFVSVIVGLPIVQRIFTSLGTKDQLPAITLWFAGVVDVLIEYWYVPLLILMGIVLAIVLFISTPNGRYKFDEFKYKMPIFGKLIYLIDFSRLLKNMLLNMQNGIRIQDALDVSKSVIKNTVMLAMIDVAINNIYIGESWIEPFETARFSNQMTVEMLKIGMKTDLIEMMHKLIEYMDIDIDNTLERIMKVLPEVAYALVGVVLIFFVIVVLVPCIQIYMGGFLFSAYGF